MEAQKNKRFNSQPIFLKNHGKAECLKPILSVFRTGFNRSKNDQQVSNRFLKIKTEC